MSLDVYLQSQPTERECTCHHCGHTHAVIEPEELYCANITHNLGHMASEAGIYTILWRPEEMGICYARQMVRPLKAGLEKLKANPEHYRQFDADNGWGTYDQFVPWLEKYLQACKDYPDAEVSVSR